MKHTPRKNVMHAWFGSALFALVLAPVAVYAATSISQGYITTAKLSIGSLVSLKDGTSDEVVAANSHNVGGMLGVVVNGDGSLFSVSNGQTAEVQVATGGVLPVLVSDMNGDIKQGDQITASPIDGVGMKATNDTKVIGIAQGDPRNSDKKQTYTDTNKQKKEVLLGQVPVLINVTYYSRDPEKTLIPKSIQNVANALAGKEANTTPILISVGIFLVTLVVVASIIYSMIRSSIISVGRNPLSQSAIYRDVIQLSALVLGILGVSFASIYVILTRF